MQFTIPNALRLCSTVLLTATQAFAQIPQAHPELCGRPGEAIPLPPGTTFSPFSASRGASELTLRLKDGTTKAIDLELPEAIHQVCRIQGDRLLVFGQVAGGGPFVWIFNETDGSKLDLLGSRDPAVSPDQHWIVYRRFYPPSSEIPADDYLLYDLTKDPGSNRSPELNRGTAGLGGLQIYPVTPNHVPWFGKAVYDEKRLHTFAADSFFWSPDSRFIVFADRLTGNGRAVTAIVVVDVGDKNLPTYVHPLTEKEVCGGEEIGTRTASEATLHGVEFGPAEGTRTPDIWARFYTDSASLSVHPLCAKSLRLRPQDLKRAEIETLPNPNNQNAKKE